MKMNRNKEVIRVLKEVYLEGDRELVEWTK